MRKINMCSVFVIFLSMSCVSEEEINISGYEILSLNGKKCHSKYLTKNIDRVTVYRDDFSRDESNTIGQLLNPKKDYLILISTSVEKGLIEKGYTIPTEEILECVNENSKVLSSLVVEGRKVSMKTRQRTTFN
jgi:hypothetical protein